MVASGECRWQFTVSRRNDRLAVSKRTSLISATGRQRYDWSGRLAAAYGQMRPAANDGFELAQMIGQALTVEHRLTDTAIRRRCRWRGIFRCQYRSLPPGPALSGRQPILRRVTSAIQNRRGG